MTRMRTTWLRGFLFVLACAPGLAAAAEGPAAGEDGYTVKRGDTLWGISRELLQDSALWPSLWEKNPFITNPNKIFPGDRLTLPGKVVEPAPVVEAPKPAPPKEERRAEPPAAPVAPPPPAPVAAQPPKPAPPQYGPEVMACVPQLVEDTPSLAAGIGSIVRTQDARVMISNGDPVQVGLEAGHTAAVGDRLLVFRPGQRVAHPGSGKPAGRAQFFVGVLQVREVLGQGLRATVAYSCSEIYAGDRVMPFALAQFPAAKPAPTSVKAAGVILGTPRMERLMGAWNLIFLDLGAAQGIGSGDVLGVFRQEKPVTSDKGTVFDDKPVHLGQAQVLRVTEQTATAVLTSTTKECRAGDQVVLTHQVPR